MNIGTQDIRRWGNLKIKSNLSGLDDLDAFLEDCTVKKLSPYSVPKHYVERNIPRRFTGIFQLLHFCEPLILESSVDEIVQRRFRNAYTRIIYNYCNDMGYSLEIREKIHKAGTLMLVNEELHEKYKTLFEAINAILVWGVKLDRDLYFDKSLTAEKIIDDIVAMPFAEWLKEDNLYYREEDE